MQQQQAALSWSGVIVAAAAVIAGLYFFRDVLSQFALALLLWLGIEGFARWLRRHIKGAPRWVALPVAFVLVLSLVGLIGWGVVRNVGEMVAQTPAYEARLNELAAELYRTLNLGGPIPTIGNLLQEASFQILPVIAQGFRAIASDTVFILIYLGFLFPAAARIPQKFDAIFPGAERGQARRVFTAIRHSMEEYLWVQTVISLIISALTYATLTLIGLENALFWSFLIFFLNYIPTIGSIVATILPTLIALVQFESLAQVALVALGVGGWQFIIGNVVQPRMMGSSLNLSAIVVLLALAIWGAIWGIAGAFLAAPLTVMLMIITAQFPSTRWLAVLMSDDGRPKIVTHQEFSGNGPLA